VTEPELAAFLLRLRGCFTGDLSAERTAALVDVAQGWRADDAGRAIDCLIRQGHTFLPVPGELYVAMQRGNGGIGSFRAMAALKGMTPDELAAIYDRDLIARLEAGEGGERTRSEVRGLERRRRADLTRTNFRGLLEAGRPADDGESAA
jgi:hypothetical protein